MDLTVDRAAAVPRQPADALPPSAVLARLAANPAGSLVATDGSAPADGPSGGGRLADRFRAFWPRQLASDDPLSDLLRSHRRVHSGGDLALLRRGYLTAERMHRGQQRKSGEPYITHPLAVAQILAELGMDTTTLLAALLHDTVEDTTYTLPELRADFGTEVALLVDGVTKFDKVFFGEHAEAETIRKLVLRAGQDVRVLIIKLADRLHNMRTLQFRSTASRVRIARATRDVLVPFCDRLGIQALKRDLEDAVLRALEPRWYEAIDAYLSAQPPWTSFLHQVTATLQPRLGSNQVTAKVRPRPRHHYSIWAETVNGGLRELYDVPRIVVLVDGPINDCYAALGVVHTTWRPVLGRFKDFIASPKNNLYRSLHTTVRGPDDRPLEVLIRTESMHRTAEYGIAANFRFPADTTRMSETTRLDQLDWLRQLLDWEESAEDAVSFLDALRCDLAEGQIHVFTSTGMRQKLPAGSTPVDLAYALGEPVGHSCVGARRGGRLIPLAAPLADGDVVEIIGQQSPEAGPSRAWLTSVKTSAARLAIQRWFEDGGEPASLAQRVRRGRAAVDSALRRRNRGLLNDALLIGLAAELGYPDLDAILVAIADDRFAADEVVTRLIEAVDRVPRSSAVAAQASTRTDRGTVYP